MTQASIFGLRDGRGVNVGAPRAVRGDSVVLGTGDVVPADMRLVKADGAKAGEMALSGEPENEAKPCNHKFKKPGEPEKLAPETGSSPDAW